MKAPFCFVLMPFGRKPGSAGATIDFDAVYAELILPALVECALEPLRAGGPLQPSSAERLMLCDYAVVGLGAADAGLYYAAGMRAALKPSSTVLLCPEGSERMVADAAALHYRLGGEGKPANPSGDRGALVGQLRAARANREHGSIYQIVERFPEIQRLKTDVLRSRVHYAPGIKERLLGARGRGLEAVRAVHAEIELEAGDIIDAPAAVVVDLYLSYRAVSGWNDMIALAGAMSKPLAATPLVREQLGLALNRAGRGEEAQRVIEQVLAEHGPSSETCAILGRVFKDRWEQALEAGDGDTVRGLLGRAIEAYLRGFEADWRDAFPGVNAVTLMELADPPDPRRHALMPVVAYAADRRIAAGVADYWDHATCIELAVLSRDEAAATAALANALAAVREDWEPEATARNLRLIRHARAVRGEALPWALSVERQLDRRAGNGTIG